MHHQEGTLCNPLSGLTAVQYAPGFPVLRVVFDPRMSFGESDSLIVLSLFLKVTPHPYSCKPLIENISLQGWTLGIPIICLW